MASCIFCGEKLTGIQRLYCSSKCKAKNNYNKNKKTAKEGLGILLGLAFIDKSVDPDKTVTLDNGVILDANVKGLPLTQTRIGTNGYCLFHVRYGSVALHRVIVELHGDRLVSPNVTDHINRNKLDNRYVNLRVTTPSTNSRNSLVKKTKKNSKYKGVHKTGSGKWQVQVWMNGKNHSYGSFETEEEAAAEYNKIVLAIS